MQSEWRPRAEHVAVAASDAEYRVRAQTRVEPWRPHELIPRWPPLLVRRWTPYHFEGSSLALSKLVIVSHLVMIDSIRT